MLPALLLAGSPLALQLSVPQRAFKIGQPVTIEISVVNRSAGTVSVPPTTPWDATTLIVRRNDNTIVNPSNAPVPYHWRFAGHAVLQHGQRYTYYWRESQPPYTSTYFNPISDWGYQQLPPGHYTIVAVPKYMASYVNRTWVKEPPDNRSNSVDIDVRP